jgi:DNA-binding CsgD family transcriptional regulator
MRIIVTVRGSLAQLSPREREVGRLLVEGNTNKTIAFSLQVSVSTVKGHLERMMHKLTLANRVQLSVWLVSHPESVSGMAVEVASVRPFPPILAFPLPQLSA